MLKHETARQVRQSGAIDVFRINRDDRHPEEIPDCAEETLFVHLARIEHLTYPGTSVEISRQLGGLFGRRHTAFEQQINQRLTRSSVHSAGLTACVALAARGYQDCRSRALNNSFAAARWRSSLPGKIRRQPDRSSSPICATPFAATQHKRDP